MDIQLPFCAALSATFWTGTRRARLRKHPRRKYAAVRNLARVNLPKGPSKHSARKTAFGCPIRVFTADDMRTAFATAEGYGLELTQAVDLASRDRVVHWKLHDLRYTFIVFAMTRA